VHREIELIDAFDVGRAPSPVTVEGHDAVVWGREDGSLAVVARRCPHLDWDLAEAQPVGCELVCPGHGWSIDGTGRVFKRNEFGREDPKGHTEHWLAFVRDGKIWVQIDPDSESGSGRIGEPSGSA
jgi:phenylpropionate dioxygenase-like ring-hydroxylating dioxygenase large terminal subunit